jgi:hypothetical protein
MKSDFYVKVVLTVIAVCLVALTVNAFTPTIRAASASTSCTGELKPNAYGGTNPSIGGYKVSLDCN